GDLHTADSDPRDDRLDLREERVGAESEMLCPQAEARDSTVPSGVAIRADERVARGIGKGFGHAVLTHVTPAGKETNLEIADPLRHQVELLGTEHAHRDVGLAS